MKNKRKSDKAIIKDAKDVLDALIQWYLETNGYEFASQIYDRSKDDFHNDNYVAGKFSQMQDKTMTWLANLDYEHREKLAKAIIDIKFKIADKGDE